MATPRDPNAFYDITYKGKEEGAELKATVLGEALPAWEAIGWKVVGDDKRTPAQQQQPQSQVPDQKTQQDPKPAQTQQVSK